MDKGAFDEAVKWARLEIQQLSPSYGRDPEFSFETTLREFARSEGFEDDLMLRLVQESKQHSWAWDVLNSLVPRILRTGPRDMPEIVWQWAADKMEGIVSQPRKGRLRRPVDCIAIVDTVHIVKARFGVSPTRNRPEFADCCAEGGSACDIVGSAQAGNLRGYKAFEAIWRVYGIFPKACWSEGPWQKIVDEWVWRHENLLGGLLPHHAPVLTELEI